MTEGKDPARRERRPRAPRLPGRRRFRRSVRVGLVAAAVALLTTACAPSAPPGPPAPVHVPERAAPRAPAVDVFALEGILSPPAVEVDPGDPILGSALAEHPEIAEELHYWILRWQTWGEDQFRRYLERMGRYAPVVDAALEERELPPSLRYLPIVESGYNPRAVSPVGAAGMWQFMPPTARFLGLRVTPLVDERRDPWRATEVALDYLADLHGKFGGSWYLALAAYNGGPGRTERILRRHAPGVEPSDSLFWALREHFPSETRAFVPKLLAAAEVARRPARYGFDVTEEAPLEITGVEVPDATSVDVLARAAGMETDALAALNAHLRRGYTEPHRPTTVRLPVERVERFRDAYAEIPPEERVSFVEHRLGRGETLSHLADRYLVPVREIAAANPDVDPRRLQIGEWIVVPVSPSGRERSGVRTAGARRSGGAGTAASRRSAAARHTVRDDGVVHTVRSGESLWTIARRHGVGVEQLRRWNGLGDDELLQPGDELRVSGGGVVEYRVRTGDTISEIADRHGVATEELLRVNGLSPRSVIRPGDRVRIPGSGG